MLANKVHHRSLQPAETEIETVVHHRPWKIHCSRITFGGRTIYRWATRVAEFKITGDFVERFPSRIINRATEQPVVAVPLHLDEHGVAPRYEQHN